MAGLIFAASSLALLADVVFIIGGDGVQCDHHRDYLERSMTAPHLVPLLQ